MTDASRLAAQRPSAPSPVSRPQPCKTESGPRVPTSSSHQTSSFYPSHHPIAASQPISALTPSPPPNKHNTHRPILPSQIRYAVLPPATTKLAANISCSTPTPTPTNGGDDKVPNLKRRRKKVLLFSSRRSPHAISNHTASPIFTLPTRHQWRTTTPPHSQPPWLQQITAQTPRRGPRLTTFMRHCRRDHASRAGRAAGP